MTWHKLTLTLLFSAAMIGNAAAEIRYQHIRNATAKIHYGDKTFLVDPYLAPKGSYPGFAGTVNSDARNPLIDMTQPADAVIQGIDAVILTHMHPDHWDAAAQKLIAKTTPIFVQNAGDAAIVRQQGFSDVRVVGKNTPFGQVKLSKTGGQHGTDQMYAEPQMAEFLGEAMGVVFQTPDEKTLYIVGDTIWNPAVDQALSDYQPDVMVMNTGYAKLQGMDGGIIMGTADVSKAYRRAPQASIVTVHMDAVNHATVSSQTMRQYVKAGNMEDRVSVPKEGEILKF